MFYWSLFSWDPWFCLGENIECRYSNERNCSYYGLLFYYLEIKCNEQGLTVAAGLTEADLQWFCLYFIKHLFKGGDVLHIECLVEQVINLIVLIWIIRFNVKQVKQKPLKKYFTENCLSFSCLIQNHHSLIAFIIWS